MVKITTRIELEDAIQALEKRRDLQKHELKEHFFLTVESFRPVNIIKDTLNEVITSADIKSDIAKIALGSISGYAAKQLVIGETRNPISKGLGVILEMVVSKNVIRNSENLKNLGQSLLHKLMHYKSQE